MKHFNKLVFFIFIACLSTLYADEYYNYFKMTCDPLTNTVKLENIDQWNERPSKDDYAFKQKIFTKDDLKPESLSIYRDGECVFANKTKIRLRLGSDDAYPYGQCGAAPAMWFSLWVNKKKVLSRTIYNPTCNPGSILESVDISDKNITLNRYKTSGDFYSIDINTSVVQPETIIVKDNLSVDTIEYPTDGKKIPAGTKILLYGDNNPICEAFRKNDWNTNIKRKEYRNGCSYSANTLNSYTVLVDINNDGIYEREYVDSRWGRFEYTDIYYLDENTSKTIDTLFEQLSQDVGYNPERIEQCEKIVEVIKETKSPSIPKSWADGDQLTLHSINKTVRLPHIIDRVTYQNKNYFQFFSDGIYGLIEYKSDHSFNEICLAKEVEENY
ncbi:MAG: hypothetical protein M0Q88_09920 [Bacilli bacterium]|nr:hypothetical protein [Bacilli bacterium]